MRAVFIRHFYKDFNPRDPYNKFCTLVDVDLKELEEYATNSTPLYNESEHGGYGWIVPTDSRLLYKDCSKETYTFMYLNENYYFMIDRFIII